MNWYVFSLLYWILVRSLVISKLYFKFCHLIIYYSTLSPRKKPPYSWTSPLLPKSAGATVKKKLEEHGGNMVVDLPAYDVYCIRWNPYGQQKQ